MAALEHRDRTGQGQFIDLAQVETCIATIGDVMLDALAGRELRPQGNRRDCGAPYGIYPCAGQDRWVAITVCSDADWDAFCQEVGHPEWIRDERFCDLEKRLLHRDLLDRMVANWTRKLPAEVAMQRLQGAGVAAGVAQHVEDLFRADPQLAARDFFEEIPHLSGGLVRASRPGFRLMETGGKTSDTGRGIGADNARVLRDWLALTDEDLERYRHAGVLED
jgi:benzylsuccinate CoA-transferase BbsF subunit